MTTAATVLMALLSWLPRVPEATLERVSDAIAHATAATDHGQTFALELAALAVEESRLAPYVLDGRCNDPTWRASAQGRRVMRHGDCDGGHAVGAWQIHPLAGLPAEDLLDLPTAAIAAARWWATSPALWTAAPRAKARAARWMSRAPAPDPAP